MKSNDQKLTQKQPKIHFRMNFFGRYVRN